MAPHPQLGETEISTNPHQENSPQSWLPIHFLSNALRLLLLLLISAHTIVAQNTKAGAFIIINKIGDVRIFDSRGLILSKQDSAIGATLSEGFSIKTGQDGRLILLLSTGTVTTLGQNSELILESFQQAPFALPPNNRFNDLPKEPSTSAVKVKLGYGNLIFNVKPLNPGSVFEIDSPIGLAGIRGTDGQMVVQIDPATGNFSGGVNMLSGTVVFQAVQGEVLQVPAGQGIVAHVTPTGEQVGEVQRIAVPPATLQQLQQIKTYVQSTTSQVQVKSVLDAVQKAENLQNIQKTQKEEETIRDYRPTEKKIRTESKVESKTAPALKTLGAAMTEGRDVQNQETVKYAHTEEDPRMDLVRLGYDLEQVSSMSREQAIETLQHIIPDLDHTPIPDPEPDPPPFVPDETLTIIADSAQLVNHLLTDVTVGSGTPDINRVFNRSRLVASSFNYAVIEEIAAHSGQDAIAQEIIAHLQDINLNESNGFSAKLSDVITDTINTGLLNARQFQEVGDLYDLTMDDLAIFTAKDLSFEPDSVVDVSKWMGEDATVDNKVRVFTFGAADDILIQGDLDFMHNGHDPANKALFVGASGDFAIEDAHVTYEGTNFGLGAGKNLVVLKSTIQTKDHLMLGSLGDMFLQDTTLIAGKGKRALLYANDTLYANELAFSEELRQVYMEATTINLTDVDFPAGSEVRLVSQQGGIDGKYPNFGTIQVGRVNFLDKVSYGGTQNQMTDQITFDQFGQNISIESF